MKYRDVISSIGHNKFIKIGKGWYNTDIVLHENLDKDIDRYAILAYVPFYIINQIYNEDYKNGYDNSTYDWLAEIIDDKEVERLLNKIKELV